MYRDEILHVEEDKRLVDLGVNASLTGCHFHSCDKLFLWSPELGIKLPEFKSLTHLDAVIVGKFPSNSILFSFGFFCYYPCTPIKIF